MTSINTTIRFKKNIRRDEQRLVSGWASVVTDADGMPVIDHHGDIIPVEVLEKAVHKLAANSGGAGKTGAMHHQEGIGDLVESFVITKEKRKAFGLGDGPEGWMVTFKVTDDDTWQKIKSGEYLDLSIAGEGTAKEL